MGWVEQKEAVQGSPAAYKVSCARLGVGVHQDYKPDVCIQHLHGVSSFSCCRLSRLLCSVSSLAFNSSGTLLAMAVSYMFERGPQPGQPKPQIIVRAVREEDVRPKS